MLFGRSWQAQLADYLMVSRKTVSSWLERGSIPSWVDAEIKPLAERRAKEAQFGLDCLALNEDDLLHLKAILDGEVFYYDVGRYSFNDIQQFVENQKWTVINNAKRLIREGHSLETVLQWVENQILSENDIASHLENNDAALDDICEIQNMRSDSYSEVCAVVKVIFERINK